MKTLRLKLKPLTAEGFAPFGEVIQKQGHYPQDINYGRTRKYSELARIDVNDEQGSPAVHIYRSRPVSLPFRIEIMEYHPLGSQAFIPLQQHQFPIVVAPPSEKLQIESIQAFLSNGAQGINLNKGVWHHYLLSLADISDFLVIDRSGPGKHTVEQHLDQNLFIEE